MRCRSWKLAVCSLLLMISVEVPTQQQNALVVIAGFEVNQPTLSPNALRAIFGMRLRSWPSGEAIHVYVLPDTHPVHIRFCKQILNIFPHQLRFAWDRQVYSGTGQAPREVDSLAAMRDQVRATPGAIGYLNQSAVDESVHVLPIQ